MYFNHILDNISSFIWGWGLLSLLLFTGLFYTVKLKGIQFKLLPFMINALKTEKNKGNSLNGISQFKSVCASLGTAMGTGNIIGVSAALSVGGPGAVFWMIISAFLGMALVYSENYLSIFFRNRNTDSSFSGPMIYIEKGLGSRIIAVIFSVFCILASFGMGGMVQSNSISTSLEKCIYINPVIIAVVIFISVYCIVSGGIKRIGTAAQLIIPFVTAVYMLASIIVIIMFKENLSDAVIDIFSDAFNFKSAAGGTGGFALSQAFSIGIRRGIFSNEAGLGTGSIAHACADTRKPVKQGFFGIFEVFVDTIVICTLTALVILCSGVPVGYGDAAGAELTILGFTSTYGSWVSIFTAIAMCCFAFSTIIGWGLYGTRCVEFLLGTRANRPFMILYALVAIVGATMELGLMWNIAETFNGLMVIPNLIAVFLLSGVVVRLVKEYFDREGKNV